jgi:hypothetical protein
MQILSRSSWKKLADDHVATVGPWLKAFRERRKRRQPHPVHDFLFVYYRYSPTKLQRWHPGIGFGLEDAALDAAPALAADAVQKNANARPVANKRRDSTCFSLETYSATSPNPKHGASGQLIFCDPAKISPAQRERMEWARDMLTQTAQRPANFGCFGLHEWAMVYGGGEVRHRHTAPLRVPQVEIDRLVQDMPIVCSHFDAFRFFANEAKPLNILQPTVLNRANFEQPACIHANMDLYKWAFKAMPWLGSDLLLQCFDLARDAREIDMRASPYDLAAYGIDDPICIETEAGRMTYQNCQRELANRAKPLRQCLIDRLTEILNVCQT